MMQFLSGMLLGVAATGAIFALWLLPDARESYRAVGYNEGQLDAKVEIAATIERNVGRDVLRGELSRPHQILFDIKSARVAVVERDGVKTVRVYR